MMMKQHHNEKNGTCHSEPDFVNRFKRLINSEPALVCPFIGLKEDPQTLANYASEDNYCHCKKRPQMIPLDHQQMKCLFDYSRCSLFLRRMKAEVRAKERAEGIRVQPKSHFSRQILRTFTNLLGLK